MKFIAKAANPLSARLPAWLRGYRRGQAVQDGVAGLVVTVLLVPQSLAYAMLAGLPPHLGLYASLLPILAYAALGSSMTLAVGPVAVASLMTASAIAPLASPGSAEYVSLAVLLALLGGLQLLVLGLLRMGFVANLLSHPVVAGFVTGSAILIALGQLKPLLGILARGDTAFELAGSLLTHATAAHVPTAALGLVALFVLWTARRFLGRVLQRAGMSPKTADLTAKLAPMVVVLASIAAVSLWQLDVRHGVAVVGTIPGGLPSLSFVWPSKEQAAALLLPAFMIALVGFVESVSVAQSLAIKRGQRINANAELRGLGAANVASAVSGGFPVTGGFARSVVNFAAGAQTPMSGVIAAALMALVLLGFTGPFERLPLAVLAATIILAVVGLIDLEVPRHAWRYDRADAVAWAGTALGVLALGVEAGIAAGVALSIGTFMWRASRPHMAVLGRLPGTEHFRNERHFQVHTQPTLLLLRIDENLFFANITGVLDRIQLELEGRPETRDLVLVLSSVSHVDLTAAEALQRLQADLQSQGIELHLAEVKGPVLDRLQRSGWLQRLAHQPFLSVHIAVQALATSAPATADRSRHPSAGTAGTH
jgi:SulP family sulfate permease